MTAPIQLVAHACLIEDGQTPSFAEQAFDPKEVATDPFGVGSITPREVLAAITKCHCVPIGRPSVGGEELEGG